MSRAFLITSISCFEVLFGQLVRAVYQRNPTALVRSDYSFTLDELSQYVSIEEARQSLITRRVEALLMESVDGWDKWLDRTVNVKLSQVVDDWSTIREIFARRNILVHADGKVSRRYIQDLQSVSIDTGGLVIGTRVDMSRPYLSDSLERLMAFGILLTYKIWLRLYKNDLNDAIEWVVGSQELLVRRHLWTATRLLSCQLAPVSCRRDKQLAIRINGWLAEKTADGVGKIAPTVTEWDTTGLSDKYQMTRYLLLDDNINAERYVTRCLASEELTKFEIATHPLFAHFRLSAAPQSTDDTSMK